MWKKQDRNEIKADNGTLNCGRPSFCYVMFDFP